MTKQLATPWPTDHPEVFAIAVDIILHPPRRQRYSPLVLMLADAAIERLLMTLLATKQPSEPSGASPEFIIRR